MQRARVAPGAVAVHRTWRARSCPEGVAATLQPLLGGAFKNPSESFHRASGGFKNASKSLPSPSKNFSFFPGIEDYQWLAGDRRQKNCGPRPWGARGSRAAEANGPTRAHAHRVNCVSQLRGLSSSILILAYRRLIYFGGPQLPREPLASRDARSPVGTYSELCPSGCQEKSRFFDAVNLGLVDWRIPTAIIRGPLPAGNGQIAQIEQAGRNRREPASQDRGHRIFHLRRAGEARRSRDGGKPRRAHEANQRLKAYAISHRFRCSRLRGRVREAR
jgi:hypothetical protein